MTSDSGRGPLGYYALAGAALEPRALIAEAADAEELGLDMAIVSERYAFKEACTISGALGAVTETLGIMTGCTNHNTRHPLVLAGHATTMHRLTGGRFVLGLGRGVDRRFTSMGLAGVTTAQMEDFVGLIRRLWRGETIIGHDGPAGRYPALRLDDRLDDPIPLSLVAFGPNSLALGGRAFDHVILHTFFTDETLQRCVRTVKDAAEQAGRDPDDVTVWSCYATIGDWLPEPVRLKKTIGRMSTYLQAYGDLLVRTNGWDPAVLDAFRADAVVRSFTAAIDDVATTEQLEHIAELLPAEWLAPAGQGSPEECAAAVMGQYDLGADAVILHGASPTELSPITRNLQGFPREAWKTVQISGVETR